MVVVVLVNLLKFSGFSCIYPSWARMPYEWCERSYVDWQERRTFWDSLGGFVVVSVFFFAFCFKWAKLKS